jgi:hypothetical protein
MVWGRLGPLWTAPVVASHVVSKVDDRSKMAGSWVVALGSIWWARNYSASAARHCVVPLTWLRPLRLAW